MKKIFLSTIVLTMIVTSILASTIEEREKACENLNMEACFILGNMYIEKHNYSKAKKLFVKYSASLAALPPPR